MPEGKLEKEEGSVCAPRGWSNNSKRKLAVIPGSHLTSGSTLLGKKSDWSHDQGKVP